MAVYDITKIATNTDKDSNDGVLEYTKYISKGYDYLQQGYGCETIVEKVSEWINDTSVYKSLYGSVKGIDNILSDKTTDKLIDKDQTALNSDSRTDPKKEDVSTINWIENTICMTVPATIYQILKIIDELLKTPIRILNLIKEISDRILEAIKAKLMQAIDCIYKNLKDLTNLLKIDFSATIEQIRYILYACPFLASAIADMMNLKCSKCQDPVECIEELLEEAQYKVNEPYRTSTEMVNKLISTIRKAVNDFIKKIMDSINGKIDELIQDYIEFIYDKEIIPMVPFPGDRGPCNDTKAKYMYTIHDALIICKRWIRCIKAICSLASDTAANELDVILNKIDAQTAGIFYGPLSVYIKDKANIINRATGTPEFNIPKDYKNKNIFESLNKIKTGLSDIYDSNNRYFMDNIDSNATRNSLHSMHVPFYRAFSSDIKSSGMARALAKGKAANDAREATIVENNDPDVQQQVINDTSKAQIANDAILNANTESAFQAALFEHEKGSDLRALDTELITGIQEHSFVYCAIA